MSEQNKLKRAKYRAGIIGAGRIGSGFDNIDSKEILTHAHAFRTHLETELIGLVDVDEEVAEKAAQKWGCPVFESIEQLLEKGKPDIISICTPDEIHLSNLIELAEYRKSYPFRIVVCEKPLVAKLENGKEIIYLYKSIGIPILINYSRRFDRTVRILKKEIQQGKYGKVLSAIGIYTKGLFHNGSHLIDLCRYIFGEVKKIQPLDHLILDYQGDKTIPAFIKFEQCPQFHLIVGDAEKYAVFELDILLEKARIRLFNSGFRIAVQEIKENELYPGYQALSEPEIRKTSLEKSLLVMVDNMVNYLGGEEDLFCPAEEALKTEKICHNLIKEYEKISHSGR